MNHFNKLLCGRFLEHQTGDKIYKVKHNHTMISIYVFFKKLQGLCFLIDGSKCVVNIIPGVLS